MFNLSILPQLKIRKMNKRWGSHSRDGKVISLNPDLMQTSTEMIRYVCIHEFCHVGNPCHNREFMIYWNEKCQIGDELKIA